MEQALTERYELLLDRSRSLKQRKADLTAQESSLLAELEFLDQENLLLEKVEELFKYLLDKYVHEYAESFSAIVTEGLQAIFFDQDLKLEIEVEQKRGKVAAKFVLSKDGARGGNILDSFGGGPASVVSLLLRILVLLKADMARYLLLDESLSALADHYVEGCGAFLQKMCKELDVTVLLITHNSEFVEHSDTAYLGSFNSSDRLQLERLK